jgi:hypothetical protein
LTLGLKPVRRSQESTDRHQKDRGNSDKKCRFCFHFLIHFEFVFDEK